jgi:hypothetical protein
MNNAILADRKYNISGNWYEPENFLRNFKSVVKVGYWHTGSSCGDWDGYFVQKFLKNYYLITFEQENNYPNSGFTLYTGKPIVSCAEKFTESEIYDILQDLEQ